MESPHGNATISREGRVLVMDISGSWNLPGYLEFVERFKAAAEPLTAGEWGVLVDIREWDLSTPEVQEVESELQRWTLEHGQRWRAFITDESGLKEALTTKSAEPVQGEIESRYFRSAEEARAWLDGLGLFREPPK